MTDLQSEQRPVLSFKPRRGRMTSGQRRAVETLWPAYGIEITGAALDPVAVFGRLAPMVLEIGFGMGEATAQMAAAEPGQDILAVDVHTPGAGALLQRLGDAGLTNVRVALGDAVDVLKLMIGSATLDEIRIYFPDPWPKNKHVKRRLLSPEIVALAADRLRPGGTLHVATDWAPYAARIVTVIGGEPRLRNNFADYAPRRPQRPTTRFERIAAARGHEVFDIVATRLG
ncbi:MAG: tRNA (guanosine(46)-N7)-methyltransferase TrmB [Mycobacteriales bacterium]